MSSSIGNSASGGGKRNEHPPSSSKDDGLGGKKSAPPRKSVRFTKVPPSSKKYKKSKTFFFPDEDFVVDPDDLLVLCDELFRLVLRYGGCPIQAIRRRCDTKGDESNGRVTIFTSYLDSIPDSIGKLASLTELDICWEKLRSLPPSIRMLSKLEILQLFDTRMLLHLPHEIGSLVSLRTLDLQNSGISSLPSSIGQLSNLELLNLSWTKNISSLPQEIGNLTSLTELLLWGSNITSLPSSIGNLFNLQRLDLCCTKKLLELPKQIGNLTNLEVLELYSSGVTSLPDSIGGLVSLQILCLHQTPIPELEQNPHHFLSQIAQCCQSLGVLNPSQVELLTESQKRQLCFALACNRSRFRTGFGKYKEGSVHETPCLWSLLLQNATRAFVPYRPRIFFSSETYLIPKYDSIWQLLADGRESFLGLLIDRQRK